MRRASPGDRLRIRAADWNAVVDATAWVRDHARRSGIGPVGVVDETISNVDIVLNGLGEEVPTGLHGWIAFDYDCQITGWKISAAPSGSITVDLWKVAFEDFPPSIGDSITGATAPAIISDDHADSTDLSDWTVEIKAGEILAVYVLSSSTITLATLHLTIGGPP